MPDTTRRSYLIVVAVTASLALLVVDATAGLRTSPLLWTDGVGSLVLVAPVVATVGALLVWHLAPATSWAWLLIAGAACAVPAELVDLASPDRFPAPELYEYTLAADLTGPPVTVVGLLGAATLLWRSERRAVASGLIGTTLAIQLAAPMVLAAVSTMAANNLAGLPKLVLGLAGLAVVAAAAGFAARSEPAEPPPVRVTAAAAAVALVPLLLLVLPSLRIAVNLGQLGNGALYLSLILFAAGLVAGAVAGRTALLGGLSAGVLLGVLGTLAGQGTGMQREHPELALIVVVVAVALGFLAALSRRRLLFGVGGLLVVAGCLTALFLLFDSDSPRGTELVPVIEPVILLAAGVGMIAGIATVGAELAARAAAPAVLLGIATPFTLGTVAILLHAALGRSAGGPSLEREPPLLVAIAGLCVAVIALLALAGVVGRSREDEPEIDDDTGPSVEPKVTPRGELV